MNGKFRQCKAVAVKGETVLFAEIGGFKTGLGFLVPPSSFQARCGGLSSLVFFSVLVRF